MPSVELIGWPSFFLAVFVFGFAPGLVVRVLVRLYPKDDDRRRELVAEVYAVPRWERPFWVAQQVEVVLSEGLPKRLGVARQRLSAAGVRWYFEGMAMSIGLSLVALAAAAGLSESGAGAVRLYAAAAAAGASGAVLSGLQRQLASPISFSGESAPLIRAFGVLRAAFGAGFGIVGLAVPRAFALDTLQVPSSHALAVAVTVGLVGGFCERFAADALVIEEP